MCNFFEQTTDFRRLGQRFSKKLQKVPHFLKNHEKSSSWSKCASLSSKPQCFRVWGHFSAKSCKKCLIFRKSMKTRRFCHNLNLFEQTTMFRRSGQLFSKKMQKVPHFAKKHEKSSIWPKLATFSSKPPCVGVWVNFSAKSCKKCLIFRKTMKNRRFRHNLKPLRANHHVSAFGSTFQQKLGKMAPFREKA